MEEEEYISAVIQEEIDSLIDAAIQQTVNAAVEAVQEVLNSVDWDQLEEYIRDHLPQYLDKVADSAWRSMMSAYGQVVTARAGPSYREGHNRLPGMLKKALGDKESFYTVDSTGIHFGNIAKLDDAAKHWRRITFGAGASSSGVNRSVDLSFNGVNLGRIAFSGAPSAAFMLPPGFWVGNGGDSKGRRAGNEFWPYTRKLAWLRAMGRPVEWTPTRGIQPHDYLSSALLRMQTELPVQLEALANAAIAEVKRQVPKQTTREIVIE